MMRPALFGLIAAGALAAGAVYAHAKLQTSSPANNQQLTAAPSALTLNFNRDVQLAMLQMTTAGRDIHLAIGRGAKPAATITVALPALSAGKYLVKWTVLSPADGHLMKGLLSFTVLAPNPKSH